MLDKLNTGEILTTKQKLTTDELMKIPDMYASIKPITPLFKMDKSKLLTTPNKKQILTGDLQALTGIIYKYRRTSYWKSTGPAYRDTMGSGAVPLALMGWRNAHGTSYNYLYEVLKLVRPDHCLELDKYLGYDFSSTEIIDGQPVWRDTLGLIRCRQEAEKLEPTLNDIKRLRDEGSHSNVNPLAGWGTKKIDNPDNAYIDLYNASNQFIRHMLGQRWLWYGKHRSADMICDYKDWDNIPKDVDATSTAFGGIPPRGVNGIQETDFLGRKIINEKT